MLETFTLETFTALVNDEFRIHLDGGEHLAVRLAEACSAQAARVPPSGRAPFSIIFRGPSSAVLAQGVHRLEHAAIGTFDLFLVPLEPDRGGARYEAVFA